MKIIKLMIAMLLMVGLSEPVILKAQTEPSQETRQFQDALIQRDWDKALNLLDKGQIDVNYNDNVPGPSRFLSRVIQEITVSMPVKDKVAIKKLIKKFIEKGADVNAKGDEGNTPLIYAVKNRYPDKEVILRLLDAKADPNIGSSHDNLTPLMVAVEHKADINDVLRPLIKSGADINAKDIHGTTPFLFAVAHGPWQTVQFLLNNEADMTATNNDGKTVFNLAQNSNITDAKEKEEIIKVLCEHASDTACP